MPVSKEKYRELKRRVVELEEALKIARGEAQGGRTKLQRRVSGTEADESFRRSMRKLREPPSSSTEPQAKTQRREDTELPDRRKYQDLKEEHDRLQKQVADLTETNTATKKELKKYGDDIARLTRSLEGATNRVKQLESENNELSSILCRERKQVAEEQNRITRETAQLHEKLEDLAAERNKLKKSGDHERSRSKHRIRDLEKSLEDSAEQTVREKHRAEEDRKRSNKLLEMRIAQDSGFSNLNNPSRLEVVLRDYKDLENGQRLDALDDLEGEYEEDALLQLAAQVFMKCFEEAQRIRTGIDSEVNGTLKKFGTDGEDGNKQGLKETTCMELSRELLANAAYSSTPTEIAQAVSKEFGLSAKKEEVTKFVGECGRLSWLLVLQPTHVRPHVMKPGSHHDEKAFKLQAESVRGTPVAFTVWPALVKTLGSSSFSGDEVLHKGSVVTRHTAARPQSQITPVLSRKHPESSNPAPQDEESGSREPEKAGRATQVRQIKVASANTSSKQDQPEVPRALITDTDGRTQPPSNLLRKSSSGSSRGRTPPSGNARGDGQSRQQMTSGDQQMQGAASGRQHPRGPVAAARNQPTNGPGLSQPARETQATGGRPVKIEVQHHGGSAQTGNLGPKGKGKKMTHSQHLIDVHSTNL